MQGDLSRESIADVIRQLYVGRQSGILHLSQGTTSKRIYFRKGSMIFANSDVESDRLGEFLIRQEIIDRALFDQASLKMKETGHRFGQTLVEMSVLQPEELDAKVVDQIEAIIYSLFQWDSGEYRFEQHDNPVDEDIVLNLSTANIILEGIRRMDDIERIKSAIGDTGRVLQHSENPLLLYQKISLNPSEGFVLSRVDGSSSVADIASISPLGEEETLQCVFGLVSAGVLEIKGGGRSPATPAPQPAEAATPAPERPAEPAEAATPPPEPPPSPKPPPSPAPSTPPPPSPSAASTETSTTSPKPTTPEDTPQPATGGVAVEIPKPEAEPLTPKTAPAPPGPSAEEISVRDDILKKHASLSEATLYDLLDVTITASDAEIKKAYYAMAKKYHPDRHHSPHLRDVQHLLEELFVKITHAYQSLSNPLERQRYDSKLRSEGGTGTDEDAEAEGASEAARKRAAEERYAEGKRHYDEMSFFDAIQALREAVRLYPKKNYHKLLAQALMKNPLWVKEAEEHFLKALELDRFDAECLMGLGDLYTSKNMATRARKMYEQAATYDPDNEEIQKRLGAKKGSSALGGIKKFFGRGKD